MPLDLGTDLDSPYFSDLGDFVPKTGDGRLGCGFGRRGWDDGGLFGGQRVRAIVLAIVDGFAFLVLLVMAGIGIGMDLQLQVQETLGTCWLGSPSRAASWGMRWERNQGRGASRC